MKKPIKYYILKEEYRESGSEPVINGKLYKGRDDKTIGYISSDTTININGKEMNVDESMMKSDIHLKYGWFHMIYEEIK